MDSGRKSDRRKTFLVGSVIGPDGKSITECFVRDMSESGARLQLRRDVPLPKSFMLALSEDGYVRRSCQTMWQFSIVAGVRFSMPAD